jgi:hypothetical protein
VAASPGAERPWVQAQVASRQPVPCGVTAFPGRRRGDPAHEPPSKRPYWTRCGNQYLSQDPGAAATTTTARAPGAFGTPWFHHGSTSARSTRG